MLYDAFISHASEDKDEFVRPLAECLRRSRVEVWYDEFTLKVGMSLRKSIDQGLAKSRYGIVVLSQHFFEKNWPEWELNGLVRRHISGSQTVILPVWHEISEKQIAAHSPSLADIFAIRSDIGVEQVAQQLLRVIQPSESALVVARNFILSKGYEPPVITDDWWLNVIEGAGWQDGYRWFFPVWQMPQNSTSRGEQLAWLVMQDVWQHNVESEAITQMTPPAEVLEFMRSQPGLADVCMQMPKRLLEFAPQLAIPGFGGEFEASIERACRASLKMGKANRERKSDYGTAITVNALSPACDECFALRHSTFGDYEPGTVAEFFVQGGGGGLGPLTHAFPVFDYLIWLLSARSDWLPSKHRSFLIHGMKQWAVWPWTEYNKDHEYSGKKDWALSLLLWDFERKRRTRGFRLTDQAMDDLKNRIAFSRKVLALPESSDALVRRFIDEDFIGAYLAVRRESRIRHRTKDRK